MRPPLLELVELDAGVSEAVRALPCADRWRWRSWSSIEELAAHLDRESATESASVIVAADVPASVEARVLRDLLARRRRVDVVVVVREFDSCDPKSLLRHGVCNLERLPLPPFPPEVLLRERRHLAALFPGRVRGRWSETLDFEIPSEREAVPPLVRTLCERCEGLGHPHEWVRSQLPLVVDEAVSNAMAHGNRWDASRTVRVRAVLTWDRVELVIHDDGDGFDRAKVADPLSGENRRREGGRGLFLMESLMDEVEYLDGGRTVVLRKRIPAHESVGEPIVG